MGIRIKTGDWRLKTGDYRLKTGDPSIIVHRFTIFVVRTVPSVMVTRRTYRPEGMSEVVTVVVGDGRDAKFCVSTGTILPNMSTFPRAWCLLIHSVYLNRTPTLHPKVGLKMDSLKSTFQLGIQHLK